MQARGRQFTAIGRRSGRAKRRKGIRPARPRRYGEGGRPLMRICGQFDRIVRAAGNPGFGKGGRTAPRGVAGLFSVHPAGAAILPCIAYPDGMKASSAEMKSHRRLHSR